MRAETNPCYILRGTRYRESSLLLEVLSRVHGRLGLVARGTARRRAGGNWQGLLRPFQALLLGWRGRGELGTLAQAEAAASLPGSEEELRGRRFLCAWYLNELLLRLLHRHDPHPLLFDAYGCALRELRELPPTPGAGGEEESVLRNFELRLLRELGYRLLLEREAGGGLPVHPERDYCYQVGAGPRPPEQARGGPRVSGRTLLALARGHATGRHGQREARDLLRAHLGHYGGGQPLRSHGVYRDYRRLLESRAGTRDDAGRSP